MKISRLKLAVITIALFAVTSCLAATLVQSAVGGTASGTVLANGSITTSAGGFSSSTTAGDLLMMVIYTKATGDGSGTSDDEPVISGGYSGGSSAWAGCGPFCANPTFNGSANPNIAYGAFIYWITNAPAMSPTQTTTTVVNNDSASASQTIEVEFDLYEFSGITNPPVYDLTDNGVENDNSSGPTGTTPTVTFGATANKDLIVVLQQNDSANLSAGSGYTLGINSTVVPFGQFEYNLSAAPGQTAAAFTGTATDWSLSAFAFKIPAVASSSVPRHRGFVN
jgi:hypothetical protein